MDMHHVGLGSFQALLTIPSAEILRARKYMEEAYPPYKANGQSRRKSRLFAFFDMIKSKRPCQS
jgi:hypothetical protein